MSDSGSTLRDPCAKCGRFHHGPCAERHQYVIIHEHKYGFSTYPISANRAITSDDLETIAEKLDIDFEPDKDEFVSFDTLAQATEIQL